MHCQLPGSSKFIPLSRGTADTIKVFKRGVATADTIKVFKRGVATYSSWPHCFKKYIMSWYMHPMHALLCMHIAYWLLVVAWQCRFNQDDFMLLRWHTQGLGTALAWVLFVDGLIAARVGRTQAMHRETGYQSIKAQCYMWLAVCALSSSFWSVCVKKAVLCMLPLYGFLFLLY